MNLHQAQERAIDNLFQPGRTKLLRLGKEKSFQKIDNNMCLGQKVTASTGVTMRATFGVWTAFRPGKTNSEIKD
jgi:hypothetical protein